MERIINLQEKDSLIAVIDTIQLYQIGSENLKEFSQFVYKMYAHHYKKKYKWIPREEDLISMEKSDREQFNSSVYFGYKSRENLLIGTIKATLKKENIIFPIEYEFGIDIKQIIKEKELEIEEVWHLGRLAIDSERLKKENTTLTSREILKNLLLHSLRVIGENDKSLMIAESDVLIHEIFKELGLEMKIIGAQKECLGSPTYPVMLTGIEINNWLAKQMELIY